MARDGRPLEVTLSAGSAYQGGAVRVEASEGVSGTVTLFGRESSLGNDGEGLVGFAGVGTEDPVGPTSIRIEVRSATGELVITDHALAVIPTDWTVDFIDLPPGVGALLDPVIVQAEADRLTALYAGTTARRWNGPWLSPLAAPISGYFGEQRSFNGGPVGGHHGGTDFAAAAGTPAAATNAGIVVLAEELAVRGGTVMVDHGAGVFSAYSHLSAILVVPGQVVSGGEVIGGVGSTGLSTGPHLHWELSVAGVLVDGLRWLDGTQGF